MYEVLIIGSGFAGVGFGIRLKKAGIENFIILERASSLGGTWRDNTYPGVACDVESHLYSYSFEPNPNWTRAFAPQSEILAYINHCADKYGVRSHIRFDTTATDVRFDENAACWNVTLSSGQVLRAKVLVSAAGLALSQPVYPAIKGRDTFQGKAMHSARWDNTYALDGKRVAVVGTGASAIQIVPAIADRVSKLFVLQRTAPWILPKNDREFSARERQRFKRYPLVQKFLRRVIYWQREFLVVGIVYSTWLMKLIGKLAGYYMRKTVQDPELQKKLKPAYTMGCKRILPSDNYYPALVKKNVELSTDAIAEIKPHSVVMGSGREIEVDTIIYATGFEAADVKPAFPIIGRGGADLAQVWRDGIHAYLGSAIAGFPNLFLIVGPNCALGHSSMIFMMESQFNYILDAIQTMRQRGLQSVEVRAEVETKYNERLQKRLKRTVWNAGGCNSWYLARNGKNTTGWPGFTFEYRLRTRKFDLSSYLER